MSGKSRIIHLFATVCVVCFLATFTAPVFADTPGATQSQLEQQLNDVEKEIAEYERQLSTTVTQKKTLTNKINELKLKQGQLNALIKQTSFKVNILATNISAAESDLDDMVAKEANAKSAVETSLRSLHETDMRLVIILAQGGGLSGAFSQIRAYTKITGDLGRLVHRVRDLQAQIAKKKETLEDQKATAINLLQIKKMQNQALAGTLTEQNILLTETKGLEANYANSLAQSKKRAAQIRGRIYELFNTGSIVNFGQAVDIAKLASGLTGVRPAFLLAILSQESNLGKNVGTCNRAGDPPEKSWKTVMKPTRDQEPFVGITASLGLNTDTTPVSCPMFDAKGKQIGWGGGMGPAQFIPSTWMGWKDKVSALTGKSPANPWDIRDACIAAGLKLKSNGADGTKEGEWKAAMYYFSGSTNSAYRFYGDAVIATAEKYQSDIDALNF